MQGLPPDDKKETKLKMLTMILEGNLLGSSCCSGGITILTNNEIVLHMSVQLYIAKPPALREVITVFAKCAKGWHRHLQAVLVDEDPSQCEPIISESPAPSLMSERVGDFEKVPLISPPPLLPIILPLHPRSPCLLPSLAMPFCHNPVPSGPHTEGHMC